MPKVVYDKLLDRELLHGHTPELDTRYINVTGDTMTGGLTIEPTADTLTAFVINDTDSNNVLTVDTVNNRVGIGTTGPGAKLDVRGSAVFNEDSADANFRIESNDDANMFNLDAGLNSIALRTTPGLTFSFGTRYPTLQIDTTSNVGYGMFLERKDGSAAGAAGMHFANQRSGGAALQTGDKIGEVFYSGWEGSEYTLSAAIQAYVEGTVAEDSVAAGIVFATRQNGNTSILPVERVRITNTGNVGIGVTDPDTRLEIFKAGNQLKLSFDATDNAIFAVDTNGDLTIIPSGSNFIIPDAKNIALNTTTGSKLGTATGQKLGFWGITPVVQQVLATGGGATVDNVISLLQTLGICKQA